MFCHKHIKIAAKGACVHCGKLFCADCLVLVDGKFYCKEHVKLLFIGPLSDVLDEVRSKTDVRYSNPYEEKPYDERFCPPPLPSVYKEESEDTFGNSPQKRIVALLLCLPPFGFAGFHRFYVGKTDTGLVWLCSLGLLGMGWLMDLTAISLGFFKDSYGRRLR